MPRYHALYCKKREAAKYLLATTYTGYHTLVAATLEYMYTVGARRPALETPIRTHTRY